MCREILLNGSVTMKGIIDDKTDQYIEQQVDFSFTNKEAISVAEDKWNTETADPHKDLKNKRLAIIQKTGKAPNVVLMDSKTGDYFIKNPIIQKLNDIRRYNFGGIEPKIIDDAVTLIAYLPDLNLEIYSYDEWFVDDQGNEQPMIPESEVIIGRVKMGRRLYGAVSQIESGKFITYEGIRVPKMWSDENNDIVKIRVSSRPLPVPVDVDDWYVLDVY